MSSALLVFACLCMETVRKVPDYHSLAHSRPGSCRVYISMRTLLLLSPIIVFAQSLMNPDLSPIDSLVEQELRDEGIPGAAIAIVQANRLVYVKGFGEANVETAEKVSADTLFRIGSTTKMLTAAAILTLVEEGKLDLRAPLSKYVKGVDPAIGALTAHQLLSHTAGLGDRGSGHGSHDDQALGSTIRSLKSDIVELTPGDIYSYSSLGYWTAGFLMENITGQSFADAVDQRIFRPLGMTGATFRPLMAMTYPHAQQHELDPTKKPVVIRPFADQASSWPGGSAFSSARGLGRFMIAFLNDGQLDGKQVIAPGVIERMSAPQAPLPGSTDSFYTYGLVLSQERGVKTLSHGGARIGFGSMLIMAPESKVGVAVIANRTNAMLHKVAESVMERLVAFGPRAEKPEPSHARLSADQERRYSGVYSAGNTQISVTAVDGVLHVTMDGKTHRARAIGKEQFIAEGPVGHLVFVADSSGIMRYLHTNLRTLARTH